MGVTITVGEGVVDGLDVGVGQSGQGVGVAEGMTTSNSVWIGVGLGDGGSVTVGDWVGCITGVFVFAGVGEGLSAGDGVAVLLGGGEYNANLVKWVTMALTSLLAASDVEGKATHCLFDEL